MNSPACGVQDYNVYEWQVLLFSSPRTRSFNKSRLQVVHRRPYDLSLLSIQLASAPLVWAKPFNYSIGSL